jgi:hypothetical protein
MSFADTPALAISVMPCAASVALNWVSAPALTAASRKACNSVPVEPVAAAAADIVASNSANDEMALPIPSAMAPPANAALVASESNDLAGLFTSALVRSSTDRFADAMLDRKPWTSALSLTTTERSASTAQPNPVLEWSARVALVGLVGWFLLSVIGALTNSATLHAVGLLFAVIGLLGAAGMVVGWLGKKR